MSEPSELSEPSFYQYPLNPKLYNTPFHTGSLADKKFLITGGAGFIGSNIVEYLLRYGAEKVRVLDNLSNGYFENIEEFISLPNFEFIQGDIRDLTTCKQAVQGIDYVTHQAALGSVPRSIKDPITSSAVNIAGHLNMLVAVKENKRVKRMVYAASSSTYGDSSDLPKVEGNEGKPLSPYSVTKAVNEMYAEVFSKTYGFHTIGLRYFNVFGPKQNPDNPYAAVIPIFCQAFMEGKQPTINGDGKTSRDFTFVENAVQANIRAMLLPKLAQHEILNTACGDQISLNEIITMLQQMTKKDVKPVYGPERPGDVKHSRASIDKITRLLGYQPTVRFLEGLELVYEWYQSKNKPAK
ncbi:MAG: SDR family oxidoreductase [Imperialibacter sp.]|uniref:SDR family oxidoreductase n=1 Tax=Imperialibacter sp. TaxID=2038411 RepID=UPI0032ED2876